MCNSERFEELLDDSSIIGMAERRAAIGRAIDDLLDQLQQNQTQRREIDSRDEELYASLKKLDAAYAGLSRGKRYTEQYKKRVVRRFWTDETHAWVERYLYEWARRQLQEGPKAGWELRASREMAISIEDVVKVMSHHAETFVEQKSAKAKQKYARTHMEWTLTAPTNRFTSTMWRQPWDVESAIMNATSDRTLTYSERMHGMMEDAIQSFYAKKYTSVVHAFSDLYWKNFASAFCYYRDRVDKLEAEAKSKEPAQPPSTGT